MNKLVKSALMAVVLVGAPMAAQAEKLAVIDMAAVMAQIPQAKKTNDALKAEFSDRIAEVQKLEKEMRSLLEKQQRDQAMMSDSQKTELARKMDSLRADYQLKGKALQEDTRKRNAEEQRKILKIVQAEIEKVAKKGKYDMVLERSTVVYVKPTSDISSKVIEALSK